MRFLHLLLVCCTLFCLGASYDMIVGETKHRKMVFHQRVKDYAIPFKKRIKTLKYVDPDHRMIKGIAVIDADFSYASANITEGGVGFPHATIRMKSQRSHPLNYEVEVRAVCWGGGEDTYSTVVEYVSSSPLRQSTPILYAIRSK